MLTLESGKPYWEALVETDGAARYFEHYGNQAETVEGRSIPLGGDYLDFIIYEPFGVSAQIIPWNYPLEMTARHLRGAGHGQYLCGENARAGPDQLHLVGAGGRGRRPAERRAEHLVRAWPRGRSGTVVASGHRQYRLHRIGGNRHSRGHRGGSECEAGDTRARRQVRRHHHAGYRSRRSDGFGSLGHLFQRRAGLFSDVEGDRL